MIKIIIITRGTYVFYMVNTSVVKKRLKKEKKENMFHFYYDVMKNNIPSIMTHKKIIFLCNGNSYSSKRNRRKKTCIFLFYIEICAHRKLKHTKIKQH